MKILIIEDEAPAARRMQRLIEQLRPDWEIVALIASVSEAVNWFSANGQPDLIFMDIELSDGQCFDILSTVQINCPIIFTTAYDAHALRAFETSAIAYLLKPIGEPALEAALAKLSTLQTALGMPEEGPNAPISAWVQQNIIEQVQANIAHPKAFKQKFLLRFGDRYIPLAVGDIAYFYAADKAVEAITTTGKPWGMDFSLDAIEAMLDPALFFRLNRQCLVRQSAIAHIYAHLNGKLKITLVPPQPDAEIYISRERAPLFKAWLDN